VTPLLISLAQIIVAFLSLYLRHCHANELRLVALGALTCAATREHLQSLHGCTCSEAIGILLLASSAVLIKLMVI
jgi:hypothetical protein